ncbi:MAG: ATP-dependent Clp protease adaptor ClpS [Planctomycetes bacterium]|nr:ATP-dependent Clp protease adaptor ClpS [Planctomycetota bacterium]
MSTTEVAEEVVVVTEKPAPKTRPDTKRQPPYAVIVENDDFHTFFYVIEGLGKVCGHNRQKAFLLATEIHTRGRAIVWTGTRELAELKCEQLRGLGTDFYATHPVTFPLGVYIEPLPE